MKKEIRRLLRKLDDISSEIMDARDYYVYELCPCCEEEVKLDAVMKMQTCPSCGKPILPCSLCDMDVVNCSKCKLEKEISLS